MLKCVVEGVNASLVDTDDAAAALAVVIEVRLGGTAEELGAACFVKEVSEDGVDNVVAFWVGDLFCTRVCDALDDEVKGRDEAGKERLVCGCTMCSLEVPTNTPAGVAVKL